VCNRVPRAPASCKLVLVYTVHYGNEGMSSSFTDVDCYVIIRKLLNFISKAFWVFTKKKARLSL
jgi:hypothetical protein